MRDHLAPMESLGLSIRLRKNSIIASYVAIRTGAVSRQNSPHPAMAQKAELWQ